MKLILTFCALITATISFATFNEELYNQAKQMEVLKKSNTVELYTQIIDQMDENELALHPDVFYRRALESFLNQDESFQIEKSLDDLSKAQRHALNDTPLKMASNYYITLVQLRKRFDNDTDFAVAVNEVNEVMMRQFVKGSESKFSQLRGEVLAEIITNKDKMSAFCNMIRATHRYPFIALGDVETKVIVDQHLKDGKIHGNIVYTMEPTESILCEFTI
ncbi:MAG: hypothetical protein P0S95_05310 [Rhabdochlamydiaceae bacterium]|nr:hypothetical protein [Candidatus Amphrikana amoebophyrae]